MWSGPQEHRILSFIEGVKLVVYGNIKAKGLAEEAAMKEQAPG